MAFTTNALTSAQKDIAARYQDLLGEQADSEDISLTFDGRKATLSADGAEDVIFPNMSSLKAHVKGLEQANAPKAKRGKAAKAKAPKAAKAKAPKEEPAPAPRDEKLIKQRTGELEKEIKNLISDIGKERTGELTKNEARWSKGGRLVRFEELARDLKEAGADDFTGRGNTALSMAREMIDEYFRARNVVESSRTRLSASEVSMTRKIWTTYLQHEGGTDATFRIVDARDPETGNPITDDSGNPPEAKVTSIAPNKAYALADFYAPDDRDKLLSFMHRNSERTVLAAAKLFAEKPNRVPEIIDALNETAYEAEVARLKGEGEGLTAEELMMDHISKERGVTPPSSVKSIKIEANLFNGDWTDTKRVATAIAVGTGNRDLLDDKGEIRNTALMEMILGTFFAPRLYGAANLIEMFVSADIISEQEGSAFLASYSQGDAPTEDDVVVVEDEDEDSDDADDEQGGDDFEEGEDEFEEDEGDDEDEFEEDDE